MPVASGGSVDPVPPRAGLDAIAHSMASEGTRPAAASNRYGEGLDEVEAMPSSGLAVQLNSLVCHPCALRMSSQPDTCADRLHRLKPASADTRFIAIKGSKAHAKAFEHHWGSTVVPAYGAEGRLRGNQVIRQNSRLFAKVGRKERCLHIVGGHEGLKDVPRSVSPRAMRPLPQ